MRAIHIKHKEIYPKGQWVIVASEYEVKRGKIEDLWVYHLVPCADQKKFVKGGIAQLDYDFKIIDIQPYDVIDIDVSTVYG